MLKATFSGEEVVEVAASEDFDVAVVDFKMPGIDSVETHQKLKNAQPFSKVSWSISPKYHKNIKTSNSQFF
ncbi:MAG: hypothetical protein JRF52_06830 [Deltaproteobacteria bacterium]|nr:hypothetical protein [Deltaproteobacteria bacterium]